MRAGIILMILAVAAIVLFGLGSIVLGFNINVQAGWILLYAGGVILAILIVIAIILGSIFP